MEAMEAKMLVFKFLDLQRKSVIRRMLVYQLCDIGTVIFDALLEFCDLSF